MGSVKFYEFCVLCTCSKEVLLLTIFEFGKRGEVSDTWKFHVKDSKSCKVNFCYCAFTGVFKDSRANFLTSSYFSMNLLVRAGKIGSQAKK